MSVTRIVILVVAVVAAGLAALLARGLVSNRNDATAAPVANVQVAEVLVANTEIKPGQAVAANEMRWQRWPQDSLQANYVVREQSPEGLQQMEGAVSRVGLLPGEPVTEQKLVRGGKSGFLAATLTPGMRALAVKISEETGAGGFILPNDHVDVIMTRRVDSEGGKSEFQSVTALRNIRVLAIDQTIKEKEGEQVVVGKTATLELTPAEAETFALTKAMGDVSLSLISLTPGDGESTQAAATAQQTKADPTTDKSSISIIRYGVHSNASGNAK